MKIVLLLYLINICICESYNTVFNDAVKATWDQFWDNDKQSFNRNDKDCELGFKSPSVWTQAVAGKAFTEQQDTQRIKKIINSIMNYQNPEGWFSASTAKDNDVYIDDNSQIMWVLIDSYKYCGSVEHLEVAKKLMGLIREQWDESTGGVNWKLNADYVASISTGEASLAAVRLYQVTQDEELIGFATKCIDWLFKNLQDPDDGLIYDGLTKSSGEVNKGKLTYSIGVMISTMAYLNTVTSNTDWVDKAIQLADAAVDAKSAFYTVNGFWNNQLRYSHLLFMGLSDLLTVSTPINSKQSSKYQNYIEILTKQASFIQDYLQIEPGFYIDDVYHYTESVYNSFKEKYDSTGPYKAKSSNFCNDDVNGKVIKNLMDNVSAAQIFFAVSRVA